jgi:beta-xylosidase
VWAPSVAKVRRRYVMAYAVRVSRNPDKRCIALAVSGRAGGPYRNVRSRPIVCSGDTHGAIDPEVFVSRARRVYLLWKTSGIKDRKPTRLWSRRMNGAGTGFRRGSRPHELLQTRARWEGHVIENPAMIRYAGRNYLFYSGNSYTTRRYATGYAICATPTGPCRRPTRRPLLHSGRGIAGPGGAAPLVDRHGRLRLGYAAWDAGHVGYRPRQRCSRTRYGCDHRRLHIALVRVRARGRLAVVRLR